MEGAPASITSNIETGRGLVNGCDAELHSLTLAGDTTLDNCLANTVWNDQYGIWEVQIEPPLSVNAIPDVSDEARQTLLARGASLFDEELVVPVLVGKASATYGAGGRAQRAAHQQAPDRSGVRRDRLQGEWVPKPSRRPH